MATIALYSNQIAQMSGMFGEVKKTVNDYKSELFSLKTKAMAIKQSICNMEDVISSIQASTSVQEEKVDSLEQARGSSEQFIEDTYRIDGNVADLVNKRKDDFYDQYKYLKPDCEKNGWEKFKDGCKKAGEWCKEHWKAIVTVVLVIAAIVVIVICPAAAGALLVAMAKAVLVGASIGGLIGGTISALTGGDFWKGLEDGAFMGAIAGLISGGMGFAFTGAVKGVSMTLGQTLLSGGASGIGSILLGDLGDIGIKGEVMSLKKIVIDVVVAGVTGVAFAGIAYGLSKAFSSLKLKMFNRGGKSSVVYGTDDIANYQYNMIENPGPLAEMPNQPAKNFYGGRYNMEVLQEDIIMYRAGNSQNPYGRWFTSEPPASVTNVRIDTAVKTHWINPKTGAWEASSYIDNVYAIKIPKGTTVFTGPVGPQGGTYVGGHDIMQTYIDSPWLFEIVGKTPLQ